MTIQLNKYINTAFAKEDIDTILPIIKESLYSDEEVILDFDNVKFFTTLFINTLLITILDTMSMNEFMRRYKFANLTEYGEALLYRCFDNMFDYYSES